MNGVTAAQHSAQIEPRLLIIPANDTLLQLFGVAEQTKANQLTWLLYRFYLEIAVWVYWFIFVWKCPGFSHSGVTLRKTSEFLLILLHVGERNTLLQFPPTVPCDQPFLSRLQSIYPSPSCAPLLNPLLLHLWNNHQLPLSLCSIHSSISLLLPRLHPAEWFLLVGCGGHPTPSLSVTLLPLAERRLTAPWANQ